MSQKRQLSHNKPTKLLLSKEKTFLEKIDFLVSNWHRITSSENNNVNLIPLDLIKLIEIFASYVIIFDIYDKNNVVLIHDKNITKISYINYKDYNFNIYFNSLACKNTIKGNHNLKIKMNNDTNDYFEVGVCTPNTIINKEKCMCVIPPNKSKYSHEIDHKDICFDNYWCVYAYGNKMESISDIRHIFAVCNNYNAITHDEVSNDFPSYNLNKHKLRGTRQTIDIYATNIPKLKQNDIISVKLNGKNVLFILNNKILYELKIDNINFTKEFHYYMSFYESYSYDICN